jgi:DNA-binding response OmpR family regulator
MDGWALLDRMREVSETPIIMLTALTAEKDTVRGLKDGADDYISKPFRTDELLARCEAVLRRSSGSANRELVYEDAVLKVDFQALEVRLEGRPLALSPQEFKLLATLVRNADRVMSPAKLAEIVWGSESGNRENLRMYISYLRKKLKDGSGRFNIIETIRGFGYRYCGSGG